MQNNQEQLQKLQRYVAEVSEHAEKLNSALRLAEERDQKQAALIRQLETKLTEHRVADPVVQQATRQHFFAELAKHIQASPLYQLSGQKLVILSDPVFIFGKGELGAEGEARLGPLASALLLASKTIPVEMPWALRVEGHTDRRPIRNNSRFASNWELSAARAVGILRFLSREGLDERHLQASGLAATHLRDLGDSKASHRRNRRIEIHLQF